MAVTTIPITTIDGVSGDDPETGETAPTHATDGFTFRNDGRTFLWVRNVGSTQVTLTFVTPATVAGLAVTDPTLAIPGAAAEPFEKRLIGPFPPNAYNDANGDVRVTTDANGTNLRIKAYRL